MSDGWSWGLLGVLVLLGAYHGVNPGMGLSVLSTCVTKQTKDMRYSEVEP